MLVRSFPDFPYEPRFHDVLGTRMTVVDELGHAIRGWLSGHAQKQVAIVR